jgi:hypothetical protein
MVNKDQLATVGSSDDFSDVRSRRPDAKTWLVALIDH